MESVSFAGIVLRVDNPAFKRERSYEIPLWGKPLWQWAGLAFGDAPVSYADFKEGAEVPELIREHLTDSEYTAVLFSDTPLVQNSTVLEALDFARAKGLNVCRMTRGFIFRTAYIAEQKQVYSAKRYYFSDEDDFITASDFSQLSLISEVLRQRIMRFHMQNGVYITDPATCYIDGDVTIGKNVTINPMNTLSGRTIIRDGAVLKNGNTVEDSYIGEGAVITNSNVHTAIIGARTTVGPYAYIRPGTEIGEGCRIGDYVEVKKSRIGDGSKVSHLAYIGDCEMGKNCNIGCGCITANYDGKKKSKTIIGDNVFVGSNSNLIAPVNISSNAFIAAGSTITADVPEYALAIARARQVEKPDWNRKDKQ